MKRFSCLLFLLLLLTSPSTVTATPILFFQTSLELSSLPCMANKDLIKSIDHFSLDTDSSLKTGSLAIWLSKEKPGSSYTIETDCLQFAHQSNEMNWMAFKAPYAELSLYHKMLATGLLEGWLDCQWIDCEKPWDRLDLRAKRAWRILFEDEEMTRTIDIDPCVAASKSKIENSPFTRVPEPTTITLLGLGLLGLSGTLRKTIKLN